MRAQYHSNKTVFGVLISPLILWLVILFIDAAMTGNLSTTQEGVGTEAVKQGLLEAIKNWNPYIGEYISKGILPASDVFFILAISILIVSAIFSLLVVAALERSRMFESRQAEKILSVIVVLLVVLTTKTKMFAIMTTILLGYGSILAATVLFAITGILLLIMGRGVYTGVRSMGAAEAWVRRGALRAKEELREVSQKEERLFQEEVRKAREELQLLNLDAKIEQIEVKNIHELVNELNNLKKLIKKYNRALNDPNFRREVLNLLEKIRSKALELHEEINKQLKLESTIKKDNITFGYSFKNILKEFYIIREDINEIKRKLRNTKSSNYNRIADELERLLSDMRKLEDKINELNKQIDNIEKVLLKNDKEAISELERLIEDTKHIVKVRTILPSETSKIIEDIDNLQKLLLSMQTLLYDLEKLNRELKEIINKFISEIASAKKYLEQIKWLNKHMQNI